MNTTPTQYSAVKPLSVYVFEFRVSLLRTCSPSTSYSYTRAIRSLLRALEADLHRKATTSDLTMEYVTEFLTHQPPPAATLYLTAFRRFCIYLLGLESIEAYRRRHVVDLLEKALVRRHAKAKAKAKAAKHRA